MLKFAILGFLGYSPMTGYEIKQRMDRSTTHFWHAKLSQIYTTLKTLEQQCFVSSIIQEQSERPDKRIFSITPDGRNELDNWLKEPYTECSPKKEELVLKLFFSAQLDPKVVLLQLQIQLDVHKRQLAYYQNEVVVSIHQAADEFPALEKDAHMWEATRRFGEMYEQIYVKWIEDLISDFTLALAKNSL